MLLSKSKADLTNDAVTFSQHRSIHVFILSCFWKDISLNIAACNTHVYSNPPWPNSDLDRTGVATATNAMASTYKQLRSVVQWAEQIVAPRKTISYHREWSLISVLSVVWHRLDVMAVLVRELQVRQSWFVGCLPSKKNPGWGPYALGWQNLFGSTKNLSCSEAGRRRFWSLVVFDKIW